MQIHKARNFVKHTEQIYKNRHVDIDRKVTYKRTTLHTVSILTI